MTRSNNLVGALKKILKQSSTTYRDLAAALGLSESAVKQMFASGNFSLKRLDQICDVLDIDITEVVNVAENRDQHIDSLGMQREQELVDDDRLLLVAYCLVNHWAPDEILQRYNLDKLALVQYLAKLDRMGLIDYLPGNRVRLKIRANFNWVPGGPIERYFQSEVQEDFLNADFNVEGALRIVKNADLSTKGRALLQDRIRSLGDLFDQITHEDRKADFEERIGTTLLIAVRNWRFKAFRQLER